MIAAKTREESQINLGWYKKGGRGGGGVFSFYPPSQKTILPSCESREQTCEKAPQETHIQKTAKSKSTSNKLKEEICFILKIHYSSEQKKIDK